MMRILTWLKGLPHKQAFKWSEDYLLRHDRSLFWAVFVGMLLLYIMPLLLSRFLPFSDLPGHLGVVGALLFRNDSEASIGKYFWIRPHFGPNSLEFYFTWLFGRVFDVVTAAKLFAIICVASLPISVHFLLRVFRRNKWLVFLVFPFCYPRIIWYGFMGSALAISLMFGSIAAAYAATRRNNFAYTLLLATLLVLTGMSHPFFLAATIPLVALVLVLGLATVKPRRWSNWVAPAALVPTIVAFFGWYSTILSGLSKRSSRSGPGFIEHLSANRPPFHVHIKWLKEWSLGAYNGSVEGSVLWCLAVVYIVCMLSGVAYVASRSVHSWAKLHGRYLDSGEHVGDSGSSWSILRPWRWKAPEGWVVSILLLSVLSAYLFLPGVIRKPVYWWAVAQRLVTPLLILSVCLIPRAVPGRFAAVIVLPAIIASGYYGVFLTRDFRSHWNGVEMRGLEHALEKIPRGMRVLGLYDDREYHYAHFQLHFGASYYVALRGGFAVPFPAAPGYKRIAWVYPRRMPPGPPWGKLKHFNYGKHGRHYDYFLIKRHYDGRTRWRHRFPKRCMEHWGDFGLWSVFRRIKRRGC